MKKIAFWSCVPFPLVLFAGLFTSADEGLWTFDNPPVEILRSKHSFEATPQWLEHVRLSSVRVNDGGSASIISPEGLVLTNHHVAFNAIQELSSPEHDYIAKGFYAPTRKDELRCTDIELNVLESIDDITGRVQGAVEKGADEQKAREQREAEIAAIEAEESERTGLRCDVIELYRGGRYAVYRYKKYTDVRLVFAPEQQAAFFGGDPDNFHFPRFALDMTVLRIYEGDAPARTPNYLRWNANGPAEGDLVFVSGNPGSTGRLDTLAQLEYLREVSYPRTLSNLKSRLQALETYSARGGEEARRAKEQIFGVQNSLKAVGGYLASLEVGPSLQRKIADEEKLVRALESNDSLRREVTKSLEAVARAQAVKREIGDRAYYSNVRGSRLFSLARHIVRLTAELEKPNEQRLPEYRESALDSLKLELYSQAPIYADLEAVVMADGIIQSIRQLGTADPFVHAAVGAIYDASRAALAGEATPDQGFLIQASDESMQIDDVRHFHPDMAKVLTEETRLSDAGYRKELVQGGVKAVQASEDPMIRLALAIDPIARELRSRLEDEVDAVETKAGDVIAKGRFAAFGTSVYPDATFTLRLSYGLVKGYEAGGYLQPFKTTFNGLYERSSAFGNKPPFNLDPRWTERRESLELSTPFNFVCTADIIGGNSGSPVIDREGRLVGLIFDGNIQSLGNRFVFDDTVARSVAVHSGGMLEALRSVYGAQALVDEIVAAAE